MSIHDVIADRVRRKMLYPLVPERQGRPIRRALLLSEEVWTAVTASRGNAAEQDRYRRLRGDLELFVSSEMLDYRYLFHLYPAEDGIWEIRSVRHAPSIRVLGCMAAPDVMVALTYALRSELGGWNSREWKQLKRRTAAKWRALFGPYSPRLGIDPAEHITGVLHGQFYKDR